jgi:TonB family protein
MTRFGILVLASTLLLFVGCATTPKPRVEEAHIWRNANGLELLSDGPKCHQMIRFNSQSNANEWVSVPCAAVVISHDPADEMFWTFKAHPEQKVQVGILYGLIPVGPPIPTGRVTDTLRVVGSEAACEAARQSIARGRPVNDFESGAPGIPTESCAGPDYFKRAVALSVTSPYQSASTRPDGTSGVSGAPIPLDTQEPRYQDYFNKIRDRIKANWVYPRPAGERDIEGELLIKFHIAKDGRLEYIELVHTSGTPILDDAALTAVKLAQPFPPVPDDIAKHSLAINGQFRYQIVSGRANQSLQ